MPLDHTLDFFFHLLVAIEGQTVYLSRQLKSYEQARIAPETGGYTTDCQAAITFDDVFH